MDQRRKLISVKNAAVVYNQNRSFFKKQSYEALCDVSLDIYSGDSVAILGDNGAGKSTLIKLLAGIIRPNRGEVINYGASTAMLAVQTAFQKELTGRTNILLGGLLLGANKKEIDTKTERIIDFSGIRSHIDVPVRTYSSGMKARLGFAIAQEISTDILLIDEGLGVGDKNFKKKSKKIMQEKIMSDQTVVMVSHELDAVKELCSHAVMLKDGESIVYGDMSYVMSVYNQ